MIMDSLVATRPDVLELGVAERDLSVMDGDKSRMTLSSDRHVELGKTRALRMRRRRRGPLFVASMRGLVGCGLRWKRDRQDQAWGRKTLFIP